VNILRLAIFALIIPASVVPACSAQTITGSTTIDIDPDTGNVTVTCVTEPDDSTLAYYQAAVTCTVYGDGTFIGRKIGTVVRSGDATAVFSFAGVPGTTYTATGTHSATISYLDEDFDDTFNPTDFYDAYNFSSFESPVETYSDTYDWFGPGPPEGWTTSSVQIGNTTATAAAPQIPTSLKVLSATVLPTGTTTNSGCTPTTDYGIELDIKYQILDQAGKPIFQSGMTPYESVQHADGSTSYNPVGPTQNSNSSATTASDGTFHDVPFGACSAGTFSGANILQIIYIGPTTYKVRQNSFTIGSTGAGHGSITNSNDVTASR
jgi:hypothetical protein